MMVILLKKKNHKTVYAFKTLLDSAKLFQSTWKDVSNQLTFQPIVFGSSHVSTSLLLSCTTTSFDLRGEKLFLVVVFNSYYFYSRVWTVFMFINHLHETPGHVLCPENFFLFFLFWLRHWSSSNWFIRTLMWKCAHTVFMCVAYLEFLSYKKYLPIPKGFLFKSRWVTN